MLQWQPMQITVVGKDWLQCSLIMSHSPQSRQVYSCAVTQADMMPPIDFGIGHKYKIIY
jgi:hypothetical protein